jgi:hypothetical protein
MFFVTGFTMFLYIKLLHNTINKGLTHLYLQRKEAVIYINKLRAILAL